jgi:hypothetical protein
VTGHTLEIRLTETEWGRDAIALLLMARDHLRRPDPATGAAAVAQEIEAFLLPPEEADA